VGGEGVLDLEKKFDLLPDEEIEIAELWKIVSGFT
jgi:hypothetical protein